MGLKMLKIAPKGDLSVEKMKDIMYLLKYLEPENRDFYIKYFN
jgi:hypothetical protein